METNSRVRADDTARLGLASTLTAATAWAQMIGDDDLIEALLELKRATMRMRDRDARVFEVRAA